MRKKTKIVKRAVAMAMVCSMVQGPTLSVLANTDSDIVAGYEDGFVYDENGIFGDIDVDLATDSDATPSDAFRIQSLYSRYTDEEVQRLAEELRLVQYEDLYQKLSPHVRMIDTLNIKTELKRTLGREPRQDEIDAKIKVLYMDKLDMRRSFVKVQEGLEISLAALLNASPNATTDMIRTKKLEVLLAFTYLDRQFGFTFGDKLAKDLILYPGDFFVSNVSAWDRLSRLFNLSYMDVELSNNIATYTQYIKPITGFNTIVDFLNAGIGRFESTDGNAWFQNQTKAIIEESQSRINVDTGVWNTLTTDATVSKYLIPLLNLSEENVYVISTMSTLTFGLTDTYMADTSADKTTLREELAKTAQKQEAFLEFWYRISAERDKLLTEPTIVVVDTMQKYGSANADSQTLWSKESGENALSGVREFMTPMKLYNSYFRADGEARGKVVVMFLAKALTDRGQSVYTHELTHILDEEIWFDGYDRRSGQLAETFARGLFESYNNTVGTSLYAPMFNLNTTYELGAGRVQNASPERFQTEADLQTYMQGVLDVVYTLDYLEAEKILSMSAEDKKILLNKLELVADTNTRRPNQVTDSFKNLTLEEAGNLHTIDDLVDHNIVSGRLQFKGNLTTGIAESNGYYIVPLFVPIYAAVQNNTGSVGEISFRLYAHELLGEYGYKNGMMAYVSNKYANDAEALQQILAPEFNGDLKAFKKAMYERRKNALENLDANTAFTDVQDLKAKMARAVETDLAKMKQNQRNGQAIATGVRAVDELKLQVYQSYLQSTADFTTSIYRQEQPSNILYLTRGDETSVAGNGTQQRPYESLSYALEKAKPGDTIKLVGNVTFRRDDLHIPYLIGKNLIIDGQKEDGSGNYSLTLRGSNLELGANVELKNLTLNLITDSSVEPSIYLNGHTLVLDNINTKLSDYQDTVRPSIYAASSGSNASVGTESKLIVRNGDSQTRFKKIDLNMENAKLIVESEFAKVDGAVSINAGGVEVLTKSQNIKTYQGNNERNNRLIFSTNRMSNINITGIKDIALENGAKVTLGSLNVNPIEHLSVDANSILTLPDTESRYQIADVDGGGTIEIYKNNRLDIGNLSQRLKVDVYGFENDLRSKLNQPLITVAADDASKITTGFKIPSVPFRLVNESGNFVLRDNRTATLASRYNPQVNDISKYRGQAITQDDIRNAISGIPQDVNIFWNGALPDGNILVNMTKEIEIVYTDNSRDMISIRLEIKDVDRSSYIDALERTVAQKRAEITNANIRPQTRETLISDLDSLYRRYLDEIQRAVIMSELDRIKTEGVSLIESIQIPDESQEPTPPENPSVPDNGGEDNTGGNELPNQPDNGNSGNTGGGETPAPPENPSIPDNGNGGNTGGGETPTPPENPSVPDNGGSGNTGGNELPNQPDNGNSDNGNDSNTGGGEIPVIPDNGNASSNSGGNSGNSYSGSGSISSSGGGGGSSRGGGGGSRSSGGGGGGSASGRITTGTSIVKAGIYLVETKAGIHQSDVNTWQKDTKGIWHYYVNNTLLRESWLYYKNAWYYLDKSGNMLTHTWIKENNAWLYVNADGVCARNQWILVDSKWYYARDNGYIFQNTKEVINGKEYRFDTSGVWLP